MRLPTRSALSSRRLSTTHTHILLQASNNCLLVTARPPPLHAPYRPRLALHGRSLLHTGADSTQRIYPLRGAAGASGASELLLLVALEGEYITDLLLLGWRRILVEERGQGCRCLGAEMERGEDGGGGDIVLGLSCLSSESSR
ncbi:hypothetical protein Tco_1263669 [Tanacetum coccineum]